MSTDTFEQEMTARMGAATDTIDAGGVTRDGVDQRLAARRSARRRRHGGIALAAAALVVAAGFGAVVTAGGEPQTSVKADQGRTTEAPTPPPVECPPVTGPDGQTVPEPIRPGDVVPDPSADPCPVPVPASTTTPPTTEAPASVPPQTSPVPTEEARPETTPPPTSPDHAVTVPPTTSTVPMPRPGDPCALGSDPDCIDPDGDGQGTYLVGGGVCVAQSPDPANCTDLDGDGQAGYPDSEG